MLRARYKGPSWLECSPSGTPYPRGAIVNALTVEDGRPCLLSGQLGVMLRWRALCGDLGCGGELAVLTCLPSLPDRCFCSIPAGFAKALPLSTEPPGCYYRMTRHAVRSKRHAPRRPRFYRFYGQDGVSVAGYERRMDVVIANLVWENNQQPVPVDMPIDAAGRIVSHGLPHGDTDFDGEWPIYIRCPHCGRTSMLEPRQLPSSLYPAKRFLSWEEHRNLVWQAQAPWLASAESEPPEVHGSEPADTGD